MPSFSAPTEQVPAGWISVHDRLPTIPDDGDDVPVWTWNGLVVGEDSYGGVWEQPAGPAVGGWVQTGNDFMDDTLGRVTHWMPRPTPLPPASPSAPTAAPWDASMLKQPGWHHVMQAFIDGACEARCNPDASAADFGRAADGYTKRVHEALDPIGEEALRTESWAAPTAVQPATPVAPIKLEDIEQYRLQMAGISTAALGYWKEGDGIHPDYDTLALRDVAKLYAKYDALYKQVNGLVVEPKDPADAPGAERIWFCKIGGRTAGLPPGADAPMRRAISEAFERVTGYSQEFCFSGWGGALTEPERAVVENGLPSAEHEAQWHSENTPVAPKTLEALTATPVAPIDMVLHCPACGLQHIDAEEVYECQHPTCGCDSTDGPPCQAEHNSWHNPPHRSHLCRGCSHVWRPADVPTNGIAAVKTKGKADSPIASPRADALVALRKLVELEADGQHASESAIEAWESARAALGTAGKTLGGE